MLRALIAALFSCSILLAAARASADPNAYASFALIIGVNKSVDASAGLLRYADDDAARYLDLFRALGARSYVLARLDENTLRLHPQVAAEAQLPVRADYEKAIEALISDVAQARRRNVKTVLYFVYAGHGNIADGHGYISLEDTRLYGAELEAKILGKIKADQTHFIVDACYSYFLAIGRGPGGERRGLHGFTELGGLAARDSVGLLLSTSSAKESHEWSGFQAGVFSHEVRSGLSGAADADGDGQVSYREMAAFIAQANASIANEQYRPDVFAHPPKNTNVLMDLKNRVGARVDVRGAHGDHYLLEDSRGVRFADFHNDDNQPAYFLRPLNAGRLYLRRLSDDAEFVIPLSSGPIALADLTPQEPRTVTRGAANDAFQSAFSLPFNRTVVDQFRFATPPSSANDGPRADIASPRARLYAGAALLGVATLSLGGAVYSYESARALKRDQSSAASQVDRVNTNQRVSTRNTLAGVGLGVAGAATISGLMLLLWPDAPAAAAWDPARGRAAVEVRGHF